MNDYITFGYRPSREQVLKDWKEKALKTDTAIGYALGLACDQKLAKLLVPRLPVKWMKRVKSRVPSSAVYNHRTHQYEAKEYYAF